MWPRPSLRSRSFVALPFCLALALGPLALAQEDGASAAGAASGGTIETASYGLFPVDDSGVRGQLQLTSQADGSVRLVLTASGIEPGEELGAAIYEGDCGPDRPVALPLTPVGSANDPYVSVTRTERSFRDLTEGDYFAYLFAENAIDRPEDTGLDVPALACGEVGAGANR